jgi:hypothetical protein
MRQRMAVRIVAHARDVISLGNRIVQNDVHRPGFNDPTRRFHQRVHQLAP